MLDAQAVQAGQASTPPSTEIDMVIEETPLDQPVPRFSSWSLFPIVKNKLRAYCKQTLDSFSDELDDMARADRDKWECVHESGKMSELIDKVSEENATLKKKIKTQKSALIKQKIALKEEKDGNKQLKSDVASMMRRLVAVEEVVHPAMCEAAEQKLGELGV
ncbi:hypothetical protein FocTR4_00003995 [Fusarium oxysporum f. sp. cubense]|uniref:Uncharacterized protein n=1 Tax=Fusarium oxysporum f. sp. cubense TaxID=61366 RepID=A0A5C6TA82_FUSOC|nr:hypothetical protein FocTR4_00003995 [Fusarium oxysporum f. sp. cubense]